MSEAPDVRRGGGISRGWLLLFCAIVAEVCASLSLKGALNHPALYIAVVLGYAGAFTLLSFVLRAGVPLGVAYGVWGACGVALTALASAAIFHEQLTPLMMLGMAVVIAGVLCVELGHRAGKSAAGKNGAGKNSADGTGTTGPAKGGVA